MISENNMRENSNKPAVQLSRRTLLKLSGAAASSAAFASLLAACAPAPTTAPTEGGEDAPAPAAASGEPRVGGNLVIGSIQEPDSLNPWLSGLTVASEVENMIYDPLTRVNPAGSHVPSLAAEVPSLENGGISEDLMTYTYKLRDDVTWHDGTPFTAADVVFTYEAIADPAVNALSRFGFDLIDSVEAPDDYTVVFNLNDASAVFLEAWGYKGILPKHIFENADMNTSEYNRAPSVGTGPYKFVEWVSGDRIALERNADYFREGAYIETIEYRIIPSSDTLLTAMETGEIDMRFVLSAEHVAIAQGLEEYEVIGTPAHSYFHFTINNGDAIMGDKLVRQAMTYGLNKKAITETILKNLYQPHGSPIAQPSWAYVDHNDRFAYDQEQAKALLEEAGWVEGSDGVREKDGARLAVNLLNIAGDSERLQVVQLAQAQWAEIGIEVNIENVDAPTFVAAMVGADFQFAYGFWGYSVDPSGYNERYLSTSGGAWLNYQNDTVDQLLLDAVKTADREERKAMYAEFQDIVVEDATNIWLYNRVFYDAVKTRVQGFAANTSVATNMWNAHEWWIED